MKKFLSTILSGMISGPIALVWYALSAVVFNVMYDKVVAPIAALYGHTLPDVPFWQWIVVGMLCNFITFIFRGTTDKSLTPEQSLNLLGRRFSMWVCFLVMAYLINWIWL